MKISTIKKNNSPSAAARKRVVFVVRTKCTDNELLLGDSGVPEEEDTEEPLLEDGVPSFPGAFCCNCCIGEDVGNCVAVYGKGVRGVDDGVVMLVPELEPVLVIVLDCVFGPVIRSGDKGHLRYLGERQLGVCLRCLSTDDVVGVA